MKHTSTEQPCAADLSEFQTDQHPVQIQCGYEVVYCRPITQTAIAKQCQDRWGAGRLEVDGTGHCCNWITT